MQWPTAVGCEPALVASRCSVCCRRQPARSRPGLLGRPRLRRAAGSRRSRSSTRASTRRRRRTSARASVASVELLVALARPARPATRWATARWWPASPRARLPYAPGVAPNAPLVDVRTGDAQGESLTSDVIAALDWIDANKATYNIRVANMSMAGNQATSFRNDPLDKAVEKLWLNGVVVVAAVGNNGNADGTPSAIGAPANDPFVITVGGTDQAGTVRPPTTRALRGRRTVARSTASRSPRSPRPPATWSPRCRWTRCSRRPSRVGSSLPATCGCRERRSLHRRSPVRRPRSWPSTRRGRPTR